LLNNNLHSSTSFGVHFETFSVSISSVIIFNLDYKYTKKY